MCAEKNPSKERGGNAWISHTAITFKDNSFLTFGGYQGIDSADGYLKRIAKFDMNTLRWSVVGSLNIKRCSHNVIEVDDEFLIIGGATDRVCCFISEKCRFWRGKIVCTTQEPTAKNFGYNVALFAVPDNFGKYDYC